MKASFVTSQRADLLGRFVSGHIFWGADLADEAKAELFSCLASLRALRLISQWENIGKVDWSEFWTFKGFWAIAATPPLACQTWPLSSKTIQDRSLLKPGGDELLRAKLLVWIKILLIKDLKTVKFASRSFSRKNKKQTKKKLDQAVQVLQRFAAACALYLNAHTQRTYNYSLGVVMFNCGWVLMQSGSCRTA